MGTKKGTAVSEDRGSWVVQNMLKAAAWERAKGALREVVALQGCYAPGENTEKCDDVNERVASFIKSIEEDGLHE